MAGCQNYGPFWGTLDIRCRIIIGTKKGTIILTTTHMKNVNSTLIQGLLQSQDLLLLKRLGRGGSKTGGAGCRGAATCASGRSDITSEGFGA